MKKTKKTPAQVKSLKTKRTNRNLASKRLHRAMKLMSAAKKLMAKAVKLKNAGTDPVTPTE